MKPLVNAVGLFAVTAAAEICGCYTFYLWLTLKRSPLWLLPGIASLCVFAWLLISHPTAAARTYAAYGGIHIAASLSWLKWVDGHSRDLGKFLRALVCLIGAAIIIFPYLNSTTTVSKGQSQT